MSDQTFGKAARDAWDEAERAAEHSRQFERDQIREGLDITAEITAWVGVRPVWTAFADDPYDGLAGIGDTEQDAIEGLIDKIMERSK